LQSGAFLVMAGKAGIGGDEDRREGV